VRQWGDKDSHEEPALGSQDGLDECHGCAVRICDDARARGVGLFAGPVTGAAGGGGGVGFFRVSV
jgi:hypothetical protein